MTKLEEKLIELGYEYKHKHLNTYYKMFNKTLLLEIDLYPTLIYGSVRCDFGEFHYQEDIDELQQAFNKMQKDLAILREIENG